MSLMEIIRIFFAETFSPDKAEEFLARHNIRTEFGASSELTGNGLTQSREGSTQHGVIEVLTLAPQKNHPNEEHKNNLIIPHRSIVTCPKHPPSHRCS